MISLVVKWCWPEPEIVVKRHSCQWSVLLSVQIHTDWSGCSCLMLPKKEQPKSTHNTCEQDTNPRPMEWKWVKLQDVLKDCQWTLRVLAWRCQHNHIISTKQRWDPEPGTFLSKLEIRSMALTPQTGWKTINNLNGVQLAPRTVWLRAECGHSSFLRYTDHIVP